MSETLGSLVDKLVTVGIKLYVTQDKVFAAARAHTGLDAETVHKLANLNLQRNRLMTELDQLLADAIASGKVDVDERQKLT